MVVAESTGEALYARRVADYPDAFDGWNYVSSIGAHISTAGLIACFAGVAYAFMRKKRLGIIRGCGRGLLNGRFLARHRSIHSADCRIR